MKTATAATDKKVESLLVVYTDETGRKMIKHHVDGVSDIQVIHGFIRYVKNNSISLIKLDEIGDTVIRGSKGYIQRIIHFM